ncbi:hypothetical protein OAA91_00545 [Fibrobacterales bacterium]|nr:hypothetical protein [Fibrobacterales bacterium]
MKISKWVLGLVIVMVLWACGPRIWTKEEVNDKLLTLTLHIQAGADEKALDMLTLAERDALSDESGSSFDASKFKLLKSMRYSMLLKENVTLDEYAKIVGIEAFLDKMAGGVNAELKPRDVGVEGYVSEDDILTSKKVDGSTSDSLEVVSDSTEASIEAVEPESAPEAVEPESAPEAVEPESAPEAVEPESAPEAVEPESAPEAVESESTTETELVETVEKNDTEIIEETAK